MCNKTALKMLLVSTLAVLLAGCQSSQQPEETAENEAKTAASASPQGRTRREAAPKAESRAETVTVPAGTTLEVRLVDALDTGTTQPGSTFEATLAGPLTVNGREVAPVGSTVAGEVTDVVSSGRLKRPAELALTLTSLEPKGGQKVAISTSTWSAKGESHKKRDIEMIGGGAAVGALVGALTGGKKGAAIGTAVGAGGGTGVAAYTGKKEIKLPPETRLAFKLSEPVSFTIRK